MQQRKKNKFDTFVIGFLAGLVLPVIIFFVVYLMKDSKVSVLMATYNGATVLGLTDRTGSIEVGKEADLVVLTADPVTDLANTRAIEWVVLDGRVLSPGSLSARSDDR